MAAQTEEQYIFYGGSTDESVEDGCRSLGELILKRMRTNGDDVAFVSVVQSHGKAISLNYPTCFPDRRDNGP